MESDVVIVGAGLTGLACARALKRMGIACTLLESSDRVGGVIRTDRLEGFQIEWGAHTFRPTPAIRDLLRDASLDDQILPCPKGAPRFVLSHGKLRRVPFGVLSLKGWLRVLREPFVRSPGIGDESIRSFFVRRLGPEAYERLVAPFVTGVYAGDPGRLSAQSTFPDIVDYVRRYGSITFGALRSRNQPKASGSASFAEGMQRLPDALAEGLEVRLSTEVTAIHRNLEVVTGQAVLRPKAIVLTIPAYRLPAVVEKDFPDLGRIFERIEYVPMVIAAMKVRNDSLPRPLEGFGFLVPRSESRNVLGALFPSSLFPNRAPEGYSLLAAFLGGAFDRDVVLRPDREIAEIAGADLRDILEARETPSLITALRHSRAIPQFHVGHERWIESLREELDRVPGLFVATNYTASVSVSGCLEEGQRGAQDVARYLGRLS